MNTGQQGLNLKSRPRGSQSGITGKQLALYLGIAVAALVLLGATLGITHWDGIQQRINTKPAPTMIPNVPSAQLTKVHCSGYTTTDYDLEWSEAGVAAVKNDTGMLSTRWECPLVPGVYQVLQGCTPIENGVNIINNGPKPLEVQITTNRKFSMTCPISATTAEWVIRRIGNYPPTP